MDQATPSSSLKPSAHPSNSDLSTLTYRPRLTRREHRKQQIHRMVQGAGFKKEEMSQIEPIIRQKFPDKLYHYRMILDPEEATPGMTIRYVDFQYETVKTGLLIKHIRSKRGRLLQYQLHNICYHSTWKITPDRYWIFCRRPNDHTADLREMLQKMLSKYGLNSLLTQNGVSIPEEPDLLENSAPPDPELLSWIKNVQRQYADQQQTQTRPSIRPLKKKLPKNTKSKTKPKTKPKLKVELPPVDLERPEKEAPAVLTFNQLADW